MAYEFQTTRGVTYYLHHKETTLKNGQPATLYFFAKTVKDEGALDAVPAGYEVVELRNGLPVLKRAA